MDVPRFHSLLLASGALLLASSLLPAQQHPPVPCIQAERWSVRYGSASANPVGSGDFVHIPAGTDIVIDEDTPPLGGLFVEGRLVFQDYYGDGYELQSAYILVTGSLQVGCRAPDGTVAPYTKHATIRLVAPESYPANQDVYMTPWRVNWPPAVSNIFGSSGEIYEAANDRGLIVTAGGSLYLYGRDRAVSWTTLATTAAVGAVTVTLSDPVNPGWELNDEIVLASTDFEYDSPNSPVLVSTYQQGERRTIGGLPGPDQASFSPPLAHTHFSAVIPGTGPYAGDPAWDLPERGEVALLTRNVVVEGESSAISAGRHNNGQHLGHVILLDDDPQDTLKPYCEVQWVQFRSLGVEGTLGRYPFHWHILGDARRGTSLPYLRNCSIHDCVNRFVVVHDTSWVEVTGNAGYKTLGSGYFLEESDPAAPGQVTKVLLQDNLSCAVEAPQTFDSTFPPDLRVADETEPAGFWLQHPDNQVSGNHAAGALGHGFYILDPGLSWVHTTSSGSWFRDNVAHSNGQHGFYHNYRPQWQWDPADPSHLPAAWNLTAWKNRRYGIWWRTYGSALLQGLQVADNKSGLYPASEGETQAGASYTAVIVLRDCTVYGETDNVGEPGNPAEVAAGRTLPQTYWNFQRPGGGPHFEAWDTLNGIEAYDGLLQMEDFRVARFEDLPGLPDPQSGTGSATRFSAAITQVEYRSRYAEDPRNAVQGWLVETGTVDHPVYYRDAPPGDNMIRNTVVHDLDDSFGYGADVYLAYADDLLVANASQAPVSDPASRLYALPGPAADYAQIIVKPQGVCPNPLPRMTVTATDWNGVAQSMVLESAKPDPQGNCRFPFNAILGLNKDPSVGQTGVYTCSSSAGPPTPTAYLIKIQYARQENVPTIVGVPLDSSPGSMFLNDDGTVIAPVIESDGQPGITLEDLLQTTQAHAWYHDDGPIKQILYVRTTTVLDPLTSVDWQGTRNFVYVNVTP